MARKEIKNPMDDSALNSTNHNFIELYDGVQDASGKINKVEKDINERMDNFIDETSDTALGKVIDNAKLDWSKMVDKKTDLPANAKKGTTIGVKEDSKVYRFNGTDWDDIYEINLNPIAEVDSRLSSQLAETDKVRFYDSAISRKIPGMYASYVDDDGNEGVYTKLYPVFSSYGIPFTSALITSRLDAPNMMTEVQRQELHESGLVEFLSHTHNHDANHRPNDMTEEELYDDFLTSKSIMRSKGYNHHGIVLPFGDRNEKVRKVVKDCFDYAIGTGSGGPSGSGRVEYPGELDNQYLYRISLEYGFEYVKEKVDELVDRGIGWIIFVGHVDQGGWYTENYMRQVIDYVNSKGIEWVKTQDGINKIGNVMQFGQSKIGADGNIYSNELGKVYINNGTHINIDTPVTSFRRETLTKSIIRTAQAQGFPNNSSGFLDTDRRAGDNDLWSFQVFTTTRDKMEYIRFWDVEKNEWTEFVLYNPVQYLRTNAINSQTKPTDNRLKYRMTYCNINSQGNTGFPGSGMLRTDAFTLDGFAKQTLEVYRTNDVWKRDWVHTDDKWGEFYKVNINALGHLNKTISGTIPARSTINETVEIASIKRNQLVQAQPNGIIEPGVIWNAYAYEDGKILIRIANVTDSPITMTSNQWRIQRLEY